MAIGDKAAAKGLIVFENTQDKRLGYQNDNQRGDDIADVIDLIGTRFRVQQADPGAVPDGTVWIGWV